jgi:O-acetyl-ADP-ribose deacetylase (regulator of RNase III)
MISNRNGNLLESDAEALVNTVNCVGVMGKGIALQFAKRFPEILGPYKVACENRTLLPGVIQIHERKDLLHPRYILNFPTKRHWREKSFLEDIKSGLDALADVIHARGIKSLAIPALGCGNGGLEWKVVRKLIDEKLAHLSDVDIRVYPPTDVSVVGRKT